MLTIVAFIFGMGLLVAFHEFGHFYVARRCGVKVIRFSIGFGKPIARWHRVRAVLVALGGLCAHVG
jgi:regulator of sigma E protease